MHVQVEKHKTINSVIFSDYAAHFSSENSGLAGGCVSAGLRTTT